MELVGVAEIAQLMGVARQRVHEIARTHVDFPDPVAELSAGRIWRKADIEAWMAARARPERRLETRKVAGVTVFSPIGFADMKAVGDAIRALAALVVDLRRIDVVQMRRCIDFFSGAAYVLGGEVERLVDRVYLVRPDGGAISPKQRRELVDSLGVEVAVREAR